MTLCPVCGRPYKAGTLLCTDGGTPLVAVALNERRGSDAVATR